MNSNEAFLATEGAASFSDGEQRFIGRLAGYAADAGFDPEGKPGLEVIEILSRNPGPKMLNDLGLVLPVDPERVRQAIFDKMGEDMSDRVSDQEGDRYEEKMRELDARIEQTGKDLKALLDEMRGAKDS